MAIKNIFAWTDLSTDLPDYVSINQDTEDQSITLTVRGDGVTTAIELPRTALRTMILNYATVSLS